MKLIFYLFFFSVFTQVLIYSQCDTNKIIQKNDAVFELAFSKPDEALKEVDKIISQSRKCNYPKGEALAYIRMGIAYEIKSDFNEAIRSYNKGITIAKKHQLYTAEGSCINNIGLIHWNQKRYKLAIEHYQKAYSIFKKSNKPEYSCAALNNIGLIMEELLEFKSANSYYLKAKNGYEKLGITQTNEYAQVLGNLGSNYHELRKVKQSKYYLEKAIVLFKKNKNNWNLAQAISNLGSIYWDNKNDKCIDFYNQAREISKSIGNDYSYAQTSREIGRFYYSKKEYDKSISFFKEAIELAIELEDLKTVSFSSNYLIDIYLLKNDLSNAKKYKTINDIYRVKLTEFSSSMETKRLEVLYSLKEEKEKNKAIAIQLKNSELEKQNNLFYYSILLLTLIIGVVVIVFYFRRKSYKESLQTQKELFDAKTEERKRISYDLHDLVGSQLSFVVNNLEMIQLKNSSDERIKRTYDMSKTAITSLRDTVWSLHAEELSSENLLDRMKSILDKWFDQTKVTISFSSNLLDPITVFNSTQSLHVMRIYQEAISNIFKHAHATEIFIEFNEYPTECILTIHDNGVGLTPQNETSFSYGMKSMQERARKINGEVTVNFNYQESGVKIQLIWKK